MQLSGKVAVITGAGSGIGKAAALRLASEGAKIAAIELLPERAQAIVDEITSNGGEALAIPGNVADADSMQQAMAQAAAHWGQIDIVFANAGINGVWAPIEELTPEEWNRTIQVNLNGAFFTVKYAVPFLKRQGGSIIITSSINGTRAFSNSGAVAYSCAKAGQSVMAKMLAPELAPHGVRINAICPGSVRTNISENTEQRNRQSIRWPVEFPNGTIPLTGKTPADPDQIARLVLFLASDQSAFITGAEIHIDGSQSLVMG